MSMNINDAAQPSATTPMPTYSELVQRVIHLESIMGELGRRREKRDYLKINMTLLMAKVQDLFGLSWDAITAPNRKPEFVRARSIIIAALYDCRYGTVVDLGFLVGGRDHSSISHTLNVVHEAFMFRDEEYREAYRNFHRWLKSLKTA